MADGEKPGVDSRDEGKGEENFRIGKTSGVVSISYAGLDCVTGGHGVPHKDHIRSPRFRDSDDSGLDYYRSAHRGGR